LLPGNERLEMLRMNGTEPRIQIFRPFGEAFELMKKILFQPFDFKKWLVIGFAAFLSALSSGFSSSFNPFSRWSSQRDQKAIAESFRELGFIGQMDWWMIALLVVSAVMILALVLALMWLGARGRFIFTDCIVRNRAAIVAPWKEFRVQGNSLFLFSLLIVLLLIAFVVIGFFALMLPLILKGGNAQLDLGFWISLSLFVFLVLCLAFGWMLVSQLMVPIMYRQRCSAMHAFAQAMRLMATHPGPIILYVLFLLLLMLAAAMISCAAACVTCCIAAIPYVGTVVLLPIPVTLCAFSLLFLRQFGPDYNVWADSMPPEFLPILSSTPPVQAPPGPSLNPPPEPPSSNA
jgi:hypothetical protein